MFDADFVPPSDFLIRTVPQLLSASDIGCVQTRWGHLNRNANRLTRAQAIATLAQNWARSLEAKIAADPSQWAAFYEVWPKDACAEDANPTARQIAKPAPEDPAEVRE